MRLRAGACWIIAAMSLAASAGQIQAQTAMPNLSGNYRCEPQPISCRSGQAFSIRLGAQERQGRTGERPPHQRGDGERRSAMEHAGRAL
jgi:hypothetical protein